MFRSFENLKIYNTGPEDMVFDDCFAPFFAVSSKKLAVIAGK